ncbi:MAG: LD-carboxypeptidase [Candidatus Tectomicrobia bacterium]|uniref:LD-carboxypeptidase n=1 Tax=Tectimicrobiota bacterium TaxID=2528274 RepID=A0A938B4Z2_UNCTE|nr:LD-carboxypeptidase [Candidatus Tectomicrobia bacterium]
MQPHPVVRPPALRPGDCIGLAAPASAFKAEALQAGIQVLRDMGFRVQTTPRLFERYRYLAGDDAARAAELNALFADPSIQAVFCCRGGYGSQRLIPYLDTASIQAHPKIFMGYSDLTSLLIYLYSQCHLVTLHGPVVVGDLRPGLQPYVLQQLYGILSGDEMALQPPAAALDSLTVLQPGVAEGRLLSCCLSLLVCAIGTPFQPPMHDTILFLEDRGERLYAIDRMLTYLKLAGVLHGVRGLVFGQLERVAADQHLPYGMEEVILDVLGDLNIPMLYGFPAGHCAQPLTLPFGVRAAICAGQLQLCESPVQRQVPVDGGVHAGT